MSQTPKVKKAKYTEEYPRVTCSQAIEHSHGTAKSPKSHSSIMKALPPRRLELSSSSSGTQTAADPSCLNCDEPSDEGDDGVNVDLCNDCRLLMVSVEDICSCGYSPFNCEDEDDEGVCTECGELKCDC